MADKSIFELNLQTTFAPNDRLVIGNYANSDAEAITGQQLIALLAVALDGHGGIANIAKTSSSGTNPVIDTYTVTYADTTTTTFNVTNGIKGDTGAQTYVWLRWAHTQPTRWSDTTSTPDDWMGIYTGLSSTQPTSVSSYAWYEVKGEKGDTGDAASIVSTAVEYQASDSGTVIPVGTWTTTVPTVPQGDFLWTRTTLEFNSGNPIVSYSVSRQGVDGTGTGTVQSVSYNGVVYNNVDDSGNLPLNNIQAQHLTASVTIAVVDWNDSTTCTKVVNGVTPNNSVIIAPAPTSFALYASSGIRATAQGTNQLTFACNSTPSDAITVNVLILN